MVGLSHHAGTLSNRRFSAALIAATARVHGLTVVTRNMADFQGSVKSVLNPLDLAAAQKTWRLDRAGSESRKPAVCNSSQMRDVDQRESAPDTNFCTARSVTSTHLPT